MLVKNNLKNHLMKELFYNSTEAEIIIKKYKKGFIENGCIESDNEMIIVDQDLVDQFITDQREKNAVVVKKEVDRTKATFKQSEKLNSIYYSIMLKKNFKLTDKEFFVLAEFILLTQHGLNNDISVNQANVARSVGLSNQNLLKVIKLLVSKKLLFKYKTETCNSQTNHFSLNLEKLTGIKCK